MRERERERELEPMSVYKKEITRATQIEKENKGVNERETWSESDCKLGSSKSMRKGQQHTTSIKVKLETDYMTPPFLC